MFDKLAGVDGEIDSEELQDMLTVYFSKSMKLCRKNLSVKVLILSSDMSGSVFSIDACRSMISMLDVRKYIHR